MNEIEVAGRRYQIGRLNALQQLHLTRRLGPMLIVAGISIDMLRKGMKIDLDDMVAMAGPVMELLSKMPDAEVEKIVFTCLSVCKRLSGTAWAALTTPDGTQLMFADMDMPEMMRVVLEVIKDNLGNFLTELGGELTSPSSSGPSQPPATK